MVDIQRPVHLPFKSTEPGDRMSTRLPFKAGDRLTAAVLEVTRGTDALVAFGEFQAYVRLPATVVAGQTVQFEVESDGKALCMVLSPANRQGEGMPKAERLPVQRFELVSEQPRLNPLTRALTPGDRIQGRITGFQKDGLHLVDFGRFKAFTRIDIPVRQGQRVDLTVLKTDRGIALAVARDAPPSAVGHASPPPGNASSPLRRTVSGHAAIVPPPVEGGGSRHRTVGGQGGPTANLDVPKLTSAEMAGLCDQVSQLLEGTHRPAYTGPLTFPPTMEKALIRLRQALSPAMVAEDIGGLVGRIRDFVENSGVYFEKRLEAAIQHIQDGRPPMPVSEIAAHPEIRHLMVKDLKPNLLILKYFLDSLVPDLKAADRHPFEAMKSVVERAVAHIEQQQTAAAEKPVDPMLLQAFSHLLVLLDGPRNARLNVYYAKPGRDDGQKNPRVSLLLEMDRMGAVRTDLWTAGNNLNVTFFVQDAAIKTAIDGDRQRIAEVLARTYETIAVSVVVNEKKIAEFDGEALTVPHRRQVDLSI